MFDIGKLSKAIKSEQDGFTLVELMVVVVIIGVLVAIAVPIYNTVTDGAEQSAMEANLRTIDGAIMQAQASNYEYDAPLVLADLEGEFLEDVESVDGETYTIEGNEQDGYYAQVEISSAGEGGHDDGETFNLQELRAAE